MFVFVKGCTCPLSTVPLKSINTKDIKILTQPYYIYRKYSYVRKYCRTWYNKEETRRRDHHHWMFSWVCNGAVGLSPVHVLLVVKIAWSCTLSCGASMLWMVYSITCVYQ
jgi:hypothetical protein